MIDSGAFQEISGNAKHPKTPMECSDNPVVSREEYDALKKEYEHFVYRVSHDLSAPLRHIEQFSGLLMDSLDEELDQRQAGFRQRVSEAVCRCHRMLDGLLLLSRVDTAGQAEESVDFDVLVNQVANTCMQGVNDYKLETSLEAAVSIQATSEHMTTLVKSLVDNAVRFRQKNGELKIVVSSQIKDKSVILSVEDNGIGIDEKYSEAIFDIFHQLSHEAKLQGDGIGLTLCRKIASKYGGTIHFNQAPVQGAVFTVYLPMDSEK